MRTQMIRSYSTISLSSYNNSPRPSLRRDGSLGGDEESANNSLEEVIRNANARPRKSEQLKYISQNFIGNCFRRKTVSKYAMFGPSLHVLFLLLNDLIING